MSDRDQDLNKNEGEGSPSSAKRYEEKLDEFKKEKNVEELAEEAAQLEDDEESGDEKDKDAA